MRVRSAAAWQVPCESTPLECTVITLGIILLVLGWIIEMGLLTQIGGLLLVVGLILAVLNAVGRPVGRGHYW